MHTATSKKYLNSCTRPFKVEPSEHNIPVEVKASGETNNEGNEKGLKCRN